MNCWWEALVGEGRNKVQFHRQAFRCYHCVMVDRSKAKERGKSTSGQNGTTRVRQITRVLGAGKERNARQVHGTLKSLPGPLGDTSSLAFRLAGSCPPNADPSVPMQHSTVTESAQCWVYYSPLWTKLTPWGLQGSDF